MTGKPIDDKINPRLRERRDEVMKEALRKKKRILWSTSIITGLIVIIVLILHSPLMAVKTLYVSGAIHETKSQIEHSLNLDVGSTPMIDENPPTLESRLDEFPWVLNAQVRRKWPWTLSIKLRERVAVARVQDAQGVLVGVDSTRRLLGPVPAPVNLPLLEGIGRGPQLGRHLSAKFANILKVASSLGDQLDQFVTSINYGPNGTITMTIGQKTTVIIGGLGQLRHKLISLFTLVTKENLAGAAQIDVSDPSLPTVTP